MNRFADRVRNFWLSLLAVNVAAPVLFAIVVHLQSEAQLRSYLYWLFVIILFALNEAFARIFPSRKVWFWGWSGLNIAAVLTGNIGAVTALPHLPSLLAQLL
ncbi:MAG: hypothetical protein MRY77_15600 [Rhodobacteraceae bacterium]|nr:hypothetical protein [Paracoccaceae bacterium]